jgi:flagellar motor protein MotB
MKSQVIIVSVLLILFSASTLEARMNMDKLIELGVDAMRLTSKGFEQSNPIANNSTTGGKAQNRRVEFVKL